MKTQLAIFIFGVISLLALPALADAPNDGIPNPSDFPGQSSFSQPNSAPTLNSPKGLYNSPETGSPSRPRSPGAAGIAAPNVNPDSTNYNYSMPSNFGNGADSAADTAANTTGTPPTTATP